MESQDYLLKILSGPNLGAEAILRDGAYIIGSDPECDLVISDVMVAPQHVRIDIKEDGPQYTRLADPLYLDGKPIVETKSVGSLHLYGVLTLGTTSFAIGEAGEPWPTLQTPELHELAAPRNVEPKVASAQAVSGTFFQNVRSLDRRRPYLIPGAALGLLILFSLVASLLIPDLSDEAKPLPALTKADLEKIFKKFSFPYEATFSDKAGQHELTIYLPDEDALHLFWLAINHDNRKWVYVTIWIQKDMVQASELIAQIYEVPVRVSTKSLGQIEVTGYILSDTIEQRWQPFVAKLKQDVRGVKEWTFNNVPKTRIDADVEKMLTQYKFQKWLTYSLDADGNKMILTGVLPEADRQAWKECAELIQKHYCPPLRFQDQVEIDDDKFAALKEKSASVAQLSAAGVLEKEIAGGKDGLSSRDFEAAHFGPEGWISFGDGNKYFPGGLIGNGWRIQEISAQGVTIASDKESKLLAWEEL